MPSGGSPRYALSERASQGGCLCDSVHYQIVADPLTLYACHCTDCQTASGAAFTLTMVVPRDAIVVQQGTPRPFERQRTDGRRKTIFRCPDCLTALWGVRPGIPNLASVYAGTLDDTSSLQPVGHIWTRSAQPWITVPPGELNFEGQPSDMLPFVRAWKRRST
jgi:hypothetical protein